MSILENIGYALNTPGSLLRGLLAGKPGNRVSGRELLGFGENTVGEWDAGDLPGFLAEVLLDPLNLVPFGALFKGGKALAKTARAAGPRYTTKLSDLAPHMTTEGVEHLTLGMRGPGARSAERSGALEYVPPGSKQTGDAGFEAVAFKTPKGRVIRIEPDKGAGALFEPRANLKNILQPSETRHVKEIYSDASNAALGDVAAGVKRVPGSDEFSSARFSNFDWGSPSAPRSSGFDWGQPAPGVPSPNSGARAYEMSAGESAYLVESLPFASMGKGIPGAIRERFSKYAAGKLPPLREQAFTRKLAEEIGEGSGDYLARWLEKVGPKAFGQTYPDTLSEFIAQVVRKEADRVSKRFSGHLSETLENQGAIWNDAVPRNFGTVGAHPTVVDPGFIDPIADNVLPRTAVTQHQPTRSLTEAMSRKLGYQDMVRNEWEGLAARDPSFLNAVLGMTGYATGRASMPHNRD